MLTDKQKARLRGFATSDMYTVVKQLANGVRERSWKIRKCHDTADATLKMVSFGEGMESGVMELMNLIDKYSK